MPASSRHSCLWSEKALAFSDKPKHDQSKEFWQKEPFTTASAPRLQRKRFFPIVAESDAGDNRRFAFGFAIFL